MPSYYNNKPGNQILLEGPSLIAGQNNYYFISEPEHFVGGSNYTPNPNPNVYIFELMVYMPSPDKLYCILKNPASGYAIGNTAINDYGPAPLLWSASYDCTNPNQQFQLQLQSGNE
ncbi:hypothetical protein F0919_00280 [Taibaiella lutea]|uniref:Uncharacterized protein n=1 Tax=Taibaiella lutea TaxID=2608001 RepID=A0A5M6CM67_9BACT|nr:hypothetical protein [Taibaiella lutea]KAA5536143.1 hypothetical protein F0919_00280 [Taibaiella lutea]